MSNTIGANTEAIQQVRELCPHAEVDFICKDLMLTGSVERTINRILDGCSDQEVLKFQQATLLSTADGARQQVAPPISIQSSDEKELPSLGEVLSTDQHSTCDYSKGSKRASPDMADGDVQLSKDSCSSNFNKFMKGKYCFKKTNVLKNVVTEDCLSVDSDPKIDHKQFSCDTKVSSSFRLKTGSQCISADSDPDADSNKDEDEIPDIEEYISQFIRKDPVKKSTNLQLSSTNDVIRDIVELSDSDGENTCEMNFTTITAKERWFCNLHGANRSSSFGYGSAGTTSRSCVGAISKINSSEGKGVKNSLFGSLAMGSSDSQVTNAAMSINSQSSVSSLNTVDKKESCNSESCSVCMITDSQSSVSSTVTLEGGKRRKRTAEEVVEQKRLAKERKTEKERLREDKKKQKEKDRMIKKCEQEQMKSLKPGECMKNITMVMDQDLFASPLAQPISAVFQGSEVTFCYEQLSVSNSILWRRQKMDHKLGENLQMVTTSEDVQDDLLCVVWPIDFFVQLVHNFLQERTSPCGRETLRRFLDNAKRISGFGKVTVFVYGTEQYFRNLNLAIKRSHRDAVLGETSKTKGTKKCVQPCVSVSRIEIEEALVDLQLMSDIAVHLVDSHELMVKRLYHLTKSIAEKPFKQGRDKSGFSFYVGSGGVKPDKDGRGLLKVWSAQLQQLKNISPDVANTIVMVYPSPRALLEAYNACHTEEAKENMLTDIVVRRGTGVLGTSRRLGKEMSRRIYTLFNCSDPNFSIR